MSVAAPQPRPLPRHIAIIMDGNGRWAKARGLPRIAGHRRGAEAVRRTLVAASELGIPYLTMFGFSSENWKRPLNEVDDLMGLLRHYLRGEIAELHRNGVRLRVIGELGRLSADLVTLIANAPSRWPPGASPSRRLMKTSSQAICSPRNYPIPIC